MADAPKPDAKVTKYEPPKELEQKAAVQKVQGRPKRQPVEQEKIRGELYARNQKQNFAKDELGAVRFAYEDAKHHLEEAQKSSPERVEHFERQYEHEKKEWERVLKMVSESKAKYDEIQKQSTFYEDFAAEVEKRPAVKGIWNGPKSFNAMKDERVAKVKELQDKKLRFSKEKPSFANTVRNAPGADFFAPTLKVHNHILLGLKDQLNFAQVTKVDRC